MGWRREGGRGGDAGRLRFRGGTQNGTSHTVTTTSDHAGRIVVPKAVRDEARLLPGAAIRIRCRDGVVEIEPAPLAVTMRKRGGLTVASPKQPVRPLRARDVEETRRRIGRARGTD